MEVCKSIRWMPKHCKTKKDVANCEKPRGAVSELRSGDIRMGQPAKWKTWHPALIKYFGFKQLSEAKLQEAPEL